MTVQTLYFPQTDAERKAFDHAIDRVLFHLKEQIISYSALKKQSLSSIEKSQWRYHMVALMEFKNLLHQLFKSEIHIDD